MTDETSLSRLKEHFLKEQKLPSAYWAIAQRWFIPMFEQLKMHQLSTNAPLLIGVNGAQGSGKSTVTALMVKYFNEQANIPTIGFSIDDFYYSKAKRKQLASDIHPLLETRGVPGTHDTQLLSSTLDSLLAGDDCLIPKFNKANDDLHEKSSWEVVKRSTQYKIIILEGWCVGSRSVNEKTLSNTPNILEELNDPGLDWRKYVNTQLKQRYEPIFDRLNKLILLKAPSFECVYKWRLEQEHKMRERLSSSSAKVGMSDSEIHTFIQYYQRITEENLQTLPEYCNYVFELDTNRNICNCDNI